MATDVTAPFNTRAPAIPYAGTEYDVQYLNALGKVLRIYFNQLDTANDGTRTAVIELAEAIDAAQLFNERYSLLVS